MLEVSVLDFPILCSMEHLAINTSRGENITDAHVQNDMTYPYGSTQSVTYLPPRWRNLAAINW